MDAPLKTPVATSFGSAAFPALWLALAAQIGWTMWFVAGAHGAPSDLTRSVIFTTPFLVLALTRGRVPLVAGLARMVVGGAFLLALSSRVGHFSGFIKYTATVNSFLPPAVIPAVAVAATFCESVLSVLMTVGYRARQACAASAILLFLFATAMTVSGLSQFDWAVYVLSIGSWALTTVDASRPGVEVVRQRLAPGR